MAESIFTHGEDGLMVPTQLARGPWDPEALHGGAPAALIAEAFQRMQPGADLVVAQMRFEFLRPVPMAPLELTVEVCRPGRRAQGLRAQISSMGAPVCRASALRVLPVPEDLPERVRAEADEGLAPMELRVQRAGPQYSLDGSSEASFASSMEMSWLRGGWEPGPAAVWMRLGRPLLPGEILSPLGRVAAAADFGNGVSAILRFDQFIFVNADLTISLWRRPQGEWIGLDAHTRLHPDGMGISESVLHDERGPIGRASQTLVVQAR